MSNNKTINSMPADTLLSLPRNRKTHANAESPCPKLTSVDAILSWQETQTFLRDLCHFGLPFAPRHAKPYFKKRFPNCNRKSLNDATRKIITRLSDAGYLELRKSQLCDKSLIGHEAITNFAPPPIRQLVPAETIGRHRHCTFDIPRETLMEALAAKNLPKVTKYVAVTFFWPSEQLRERAGLASPRLDTAFLTRWLSSSYLLLPNNILKDESLRPPLSQVL